MLSDGSDSRVSDPLAEPYDSRSMRAAIERIDAVFPGAEVDIEFREGRPYRYRLMLLSVPFDQNRGDYGDWIDHANALADEAERWKA